MSFANPHRHRVTLMYCQMYPHLLPEQVTDLHLLKTYAQMLEVQAHLKRLISKEDAFEIVFGFPRPPEWKDFWRLYRVY